MKKKLKVAINWYWRIWICVAKIISNRDDIELVAINSTSSDDMTVYLTKYDSVHGVFKDDVSISDWFLYIWKNTKAKIFCDRDINNLNFWEYGAEVVLECTWQFNTKELSKTHLKNWVKKVIFSAPAKDNTPTYVIWVNQENYSWENIISNASCTTNCLWPVAKIIDNYFWIEKWLVTTIHSYTSSQKILDLKHKKDKRRARAAAVNIIPTTTWAAKAMKLIMPQLDGKIHWQSIRVPVPNVSIIDANFVLKKDTNLTEVNNLLEKLSKDSYKWILEYDTEYRVSSDICWNPNSAIIASDMNQIVDWNMLKIMAWYDNEWWYSNRLVEMALFISK